MIVVGVELNPHGVHVDWQRGRTAMVGMLRELIDEGKEKGKCSEEHGIKKVSAIWRFGRACTMRGIADVHSASETQLTCCRYDSDHR